MASLHTTFKTALLACLVAAALGSPEVCRGQIGPGVAHMRAGAFDSAHVYFSNALITAQNNQDWATAAKAHNALGVCHDELANFTSSARNWNAALELYRANGDSSGVAKVLNNYGGSLYRQGRNAAAVANLQQALALRDTSANPAGSANTLSNLGAALVELHRYDEANNELRAAARFKTMAGDSVGALYVHINRSVMFAEMGDTTQAIGVLESILPAATTYGTHSQAVKVLHNLSKYHAFAGDPEKAQMYLDQYAAKARPELMPEVRDNLLAAEMRLEAAQTRNHLDAMRISRLERNGALFGGIALLFILLAVFLFITRRRAIVQRSLAQMQLKGTIYDHHSVAKMIDLSIESVKGDQPEKAADQLEALRDVFFSKSGEDINNRLELLKRRVSSMATLVFKVQCPDFNEQPIDEVFTICEQLVFHHAQHSNPDNIFLLVDMEQGVKITLRSVGKSQPVSRSVMADMAYSVVKQMGGKVNILHTGSAQEQELSTFVTF